MARDSHTEENGGKKKASAWLPSSLSFILLAASLFCLWTLWQQLSSLRAARAEREANLETLMSQKSELEALLGLSPCDAAEKAGILLKTAPDNLEKPKSAPEKEAGAAAEKTTSAKEDFTLIAADIPEGARLAPLRFSPGLKKTQKAGAWGYPNIICKNDPAYNSLLTGENLSAAPELSYSQGAASAILDRSPEIIVRAAPISPCDSGPLLDNNGDSVGINSMSALDGDSYRQTSLALSASDLSAFLQKHGVPINKSK